MRLPLRERYRKRIVIDADIARAASTSQSTEASQCFEFLVVLQQCHHKAVFSNELWREWLNHRSRYSMVWMREMRGRKLVVRIPDPRDSILREKINRMAESTVALDVMSKDVHLLEAALATDKIVASKDVKAHECFEDASHGIGEIRDVMWANPLSEDDACKGWLQRGAPIERERQLGYQHRER